MRVKPASDYQLKPRVRLPRRCRGSCRDFRLPTGTLRLADYLGRTRSDSGLEIRGILVANATMFSHLLPGFSSGSKHLLLP